MYIPRIWDTSIDTQTTQSTSSILPPPTSLHKLSRVLAGGSVATGIVTEYFVYTVVTEFGQGIVEPSAQGGLSSDVLWSEERSFI
jgi:hypothetical protein